MPAARMRVLLPARQTDDRTRRAAAAIRYLRPPTYSGEKTTTETATDLANERVEALADHGDLVVCAAGRLAALDEPRLHRRLGAVVEQHRGDLGDVVVGRADAHRAVPAAPVVLVAREAVDEEDAAAVVARARAARARGRRRRHRLAQQRERDLNGHDLASRGGERARAARGGGAAGSGGVKPRRSCLTMTGPRAMAGWLSPTDASNRRATPEARM